MSRPFLVAQLSDPHIGAHRTGSDPGAALAAAVEAVLALPDRPDVALITGDITNAGAASDYQIACELLARLEMPTYVLPGNHDDREGLRRAFAVPGRGEEPILQTVDLGPLRLVLLDSVRPGDDAGELDGARLAWLDQQLALAPAQPTLLAMHHPPLTTGARSLDEIGLPASQRGALGEVLERHPQVRRVVAGHLHQTIVGELAGRGVLAIPSTYLQGRLDFSAAELALAADPAGFAIHALLGEEIVSHIRPVL